MRRGATIALLAVTLGAASAMAAVTATPVFIQTPVVAQTEIIAATANCTAANQPFTCCTGSGAGTGCVITAASTLAAPTWVTVYTPTGANGARVYAINVGSSDTVPHLVTCVLTRAALSRGTPMAVVVPAGAGFTTAVPISALMSPSNAPGLPVDSDGNPYIQMATTTDKVDCRFTTTISAGTLVVITVTASEF